MKDEQTPSADPQAPRGPAPRAATPPLLRALFGLGSLALLGTAALHGARALAPPAGDDSSPQRHAIFVGINAGLALGLLLRPRWLALPLGLLVLQQLGSHGSLALAALRAGATPGLEDLSVVGGLPLLWGALVWELRRRS